MPGALRHDGREGEGVEGGHLTDPDLAEPQLVRDLSRPDHLSGRPVLPQPE